MKVLTPTSPSLDLKNDAPFARVARHLRELLREDNRSGEFLPSERKLSERLRVGRTTVRRALSILADEGLIERRGMRLRQISPALKSPAVKPSVVKSSAGASGIVGRSIAVLVPPSHQTNIAGLGTSWRRYASLGAFEAVRDAGWHSISFNADTFELDAAILLAQEQPLGVIIPEIFGRDTGHVIAAQALVERGVPVVTYGNHPRLTPFDRVASDHDAGGYALTQYFIERGLKRIVLLAPLPHDSYWLAARHRGYARAMSEAGLVVRPIHDCADVHGPDCLDAALFEHRARSVAGHLLDLLNGPESPEALLMASDRFVPYVARACRLLKREPGRDVRLAGYDNIYPLCEEHRYESTLPEVTVDKLNDHAGAEAVRLLLRRIEGQLPADQPQVVMMQPQLVHVPSARDQHAITPPVNGPL